MEPVNPVDKYAVAVKKNNVTVGHLPLGCSGKFGKTIFYLLRADEWNECKVIVTGKPVNRGDGDGMQVPYLLKFHGEKSLIGMLKQQMYWNSYFYLYTAYAYLYYFLGNVFVFDSHSRNNAGRYDQNAFGTLLRFQKFENVADYVVLLF